MAARHYPTVAERLEAATDRSDVDGCWPLLVGASTRSGHKQLSVNNRMVLAHRIAYEIHVGPIPEGSVVRHTCDNPPCVRPSHLVAGTVADNNRDRDERGRAAALKGSANGSSKLTENAIQELRRLRASGLSQRQAGQRLGVTQSTVSLIERGKTWTHTNEGANE